MENSDDKGILDGGVRVSDDSEVLTGKSNGKSVESGDLRFNDRHGVSNNRIAEKVSHNNRWESWGVMNMVGRVLGGKLDMDDEVENVNDSENWGQRNLVGNTTSWQDVIGESESENHGEANNVEGTNTWQDATVEPTSASGIDIQGRDINGDSIKLDLDCRVEGNSLNRIQDLVSHKIVPDGLLESEEINVVKAKVRKLDGHGEIEEVNDVKEGVFIQKGCGAQDSLHCEIVTDVPLETEEVNAVKAGMLALKECGVETEKIEEYSVSDLVWGKVRSHPWWPGQIFSPSDASDKAKKYFKKDNYLVAYFGDESFAWNGGSKLMPFRMHFSEMEKQSHSDGFSHALSCALDEVARRVELGLSCPCLAQEVRDEIKFQIIENAGIREESSIRSGGDNVSNVATFSPGHTLEFIESLAKCPPSEHDRLQFTLSKAQLLAYTRWKGRHQLPAFEEHIALLEEDSQYNAIGEGNDSTKAMEGIFPCPVSDAANDVSSENIKLLAKSVSSRKRKELSGDEEHPKLKEKSMSVLMSSESSSLQNGDKKYVKRKKLNSSMSSSSKSKKLKTLASTGKAITKIISAKVTTPDMVLSKLVLAAKKPMQGHDALIPVVSMLRKFRDSICLEQSSLAGQVAAGKCNGEQPSHTADISGFGGTEDSYWTDRIIRRYSQDLNLHKSMKPYGKDAQLESDVAAVPKFDDNKESNGIVDLDEGTQTILTNSVSDEYRPTALVLKFKNLDSIPSVENLNEIFRCHGILYESETKILNRSKSVKVIFQRPNDADTAFNSVGKYSIFGPSLVSYRLRYVTLPRKSQKTSKT